MTDLVRAIMWRLVDHGPAYAMELSRCCQIRPGTIYNTLARMLDQGLVTAHREARDETASGISRRYYTVTRHGVMLLEERRDER